jgi:hypothetical protein
MNNVHDTPDGKPKSFGGWEHIRDIGGFKYGKNDVIVVSLARLTKGNDSTYWYTIKECFIGSDGKPHRKPLYQKDKWGKDRVALSISIRADDKERLDNWIKVFEDIQMDVGELAEQLHDPEHETLKKESELRLDEDAVGSEIDKDLEPF